MTPSRGLALLAVSTLLIATGAGCGEETAADPEPGAAASASSTGTASPSGSASASASPTPTPTSAPSPTESGAPVSSPVVDKAVRKALAAGFPALVPAGVPVGWTVESAAYTPRRGGTWRIELTDDSGAAVSLLQRGQQLEPFVAENLGAEMQQSGTVNLGQYGTGRWTVYTGGEAAGVDTAIVTYLARTSALVAGPDQDTLVELAEQLLTAEDGGSGAGDG